MQPTHADGETQYNGSENTKSEVPGTRRLLPELPQRAGARLAGTGKMQ